MYINKRGKEEIQKLFKKPVVTPEVTPPVDFVKLTAKDFGGKFLKKPIKKYFKGTDEAFNKLYTAWDNQRKDIREIAIPLRVSMSGTDTNAKIVKKINASKGIAKPINNKASNATIPYST